MVRGKNSVTHSLRAPNEASRTQWLRALAQAGRRVSTFDSAGTTPSGSATLSRRASEADASSIHVVSTGSSDALAGGWAAPPADIAKDAGAEPVYGDALETKLANVRQQRQSLERMLREAAAIVNGHEQLLCLRSAERACAVISSEDGWALTSCCTSMRTVERGRRSGSDNFGTATAELVEDLSSVIVAAEDRGAHTGPAPAPLTSGAHSPA